MAEGQARYPNRLHFAPASGVHGCQQAFVENAWVVFAGKRSMQIANTSDKKGLQKTGVIFAFESAAQAASLPIQLLSVQFLPMPFPGTVF